MDCPSCGRQQDPSNRYCDTCGTLMTADENSSDSRTMFEQPAAPDTGYRNYPGAAGPTWSSVPPPPGGSHRAAASPGAVAAKQPLLFRLAHGEQVLKAYDVVTLRTGLFKRQRGHGTLYVTDARVVFYAQVYPRGTQKASWIFQQTKLEDISGLSAHVSRRISLGLVVLTLFCGLATLANLFSFFPLAFLFAILTVVFAIVLVRDASRRGDVGVVIKSRENGNSPIAFGHLPQQRGFFDALGRLLILPIALFLRSYSAWDVVAGDPADDANALLHEIGALIIDLQTRGTMAYPEWSIAVPDGAVGAARAQ
jgi:hypothetical protein